MLVLGLVELPWWSLFPIAFLLYALYTCRNFNYFRKQGIKHDTPLPILGTLLPIFTTPAADLDRRLIEKYGDEECVGGVADQQTPQNTPVMTGVTTGSATQRSDANASTGRSSTCAMTRQQQENLTSTLQSEERFSQHEPEASLFEFREYRRCGFLNDKPTLVILGEEMLSEIMIKQFHAFTDRMTFKSGSHITDNMLLNLEGAHWKHVRNEMTPTFTSGKLKMMNGEINRCAAVLSDSLLEESRMGGEVEMKEFTGAFTMDVIASTGFGLRVDSFKDRNNEFVRHAKRAFAREQTDPKFLLIIFFPWLVPLMSKLGIDVDFIPKDIRDFFEKIVTQTMELRSADADKSRADFVQLMLKAQKGEDIHDEDTPEDAKKKYTGLTTNEIVANAMLFFVGGYDTTATSLSFFMHNMAVYPEIQERLVEEINSVVADKEVIDPGIVQQMPYLDQCVMENLRLYPPLTATNRVANQDITIRGVFIRKGMPINIPINALQHHPRRWPDPWTFDPERFAPENKNNRRTFYFMPFSNGPRNCVGMRLALQELKVAIIHVLRKVKITKSDKTKVPVEFDMKPGFLTAKDGVNLKVESRI